MPTKEDYEAMHSDAVKMMGAVEDLAGIAKRMANFSANLIEESANKKPCKVEEKKEGKPSSDKDSIKKLMVMKLKRAK